MKKYRIDDEAAYGEMAEDDVAELVASGALVEVPDPTEEAIENDVLQVLALCEVMGVAGDLLAALIARRFVRMLEATTQEAST